MKSKKVNVSARKRRLIVGMLSVLFMMTSCDVVRTITTTAETYHQDDKSVIIQTKTIESYSGKKNT